jgi:serine/threonine protein kinase
MRGILEAINYCHKTRICHRDIKPENILINENDEIKIIDLGFAAIVRENEKNLSEFKGTEAYMAPEIIKRLRYNEKCDIWSIGVVFYILLSFSLPFEDR